jgi:hypothetical protein
MNFSWNFLLEFLLEVALRAREEVARFVIGRWRGPTLRPHGRWFFKGYTKAQEIPV